MKWCEGCDGGSSRREMKSSVVLLAIIAAADAFSSGASVGEDLPQGHPMQACDAIGVCALGCPTGMTAVAPPTRSLAYSVTGPEEGYTPGELVEVHVSVHQRLLRNKLQAAAGEQMTLPSTLIFDHPTARLLAGTVAPPPPSPATPVVPEALV